MYVYPTRDGQLRGEGVAFLSPTGVTESIAKGNAIAIRGTVAAVGAINAAMGMGGVFIYERDNAGAWRAAPMLKPALDEINAITGRERRCSEQGKAEIFDCNNAELLSFVPATCR